ncbi:Low-density lipoprotein receptor-related protein 6 [Halocaridina rubra]|uniref:Low-density lipoprotein receptor-related protein 6 n=1 Tax=Halocaridina rubra TaxID=373956 RepID=A0AAN9A836_HALRR
MKLTWAVGDPCRLSVSYCYGCSPELLFANRKDIRIIEVGKERQSKQIIVKDVTDAASVDYYYKDQLVCWTDIDNELIKCVEINRGGDAKDHREVIVITRGIVSPDGLAVDWLGAKIYWTDSDTDKIEVAELYTKHRKVLFWENHDQPRAIALVPSEGLMFWTDWGENPKIERAGMNGDPSTRWTIVHEEILWPNGLTVDYDQRMIYWADARLSFIASVDFEGKRRTKVVQGKLPHPFALTYFNYTLYWTDWETRAIHYCDVGKNRSCETQQKLGTNLSPMYIHVYDTARQPYVKTPCQENNGGCSHLCLAAPTPERFSCACPTGVNLIDNFTCSDGIMSEKRREEWLNCTEKGSKMMLRVERLKLLEYIANVEVGNMAVRLFGVTSEIRAVLDALGWTDIKDRNSLQSPEEMLILARRTDLRRISLDTPDYTAVVMPVTGVKHAIAVDYDPVNGFAYWTDDEAQCIQRAMLNGTEQQVVVSAEVSRPEGIAVDWVARNLYWTDTGPDRIEVSRLNGTSRKILIAESLDEPRAIAVDPDGGLMFWADWGQKPKIERAALDGSLRLVVIDSDLGWPNGVAIDFALRKIYWCDAKTDKIEMASMDGSERRVVVSEQLSHAYGFSLLGSYLYWTDWQRRSIERVNKLNGSQREMIIENVADVMGLKAASTARNGGTNPCGRNNGECSHLCLNRPTNYTCGCPIGYELTQDEKHCVIPEAFLLYTRKEDIRRISLLTSHNVPIPVTGIQEAMSIDFDSIENRLYWTDISVKSISRAFMNGSQLEPVIEFGLEYPEGMAVDWLARNIYWTDMGNNRIEVARLDGTSRRVLLWENVASPRSLALDPGQGFMYWSEWSDKPIISRAHLDASEPIAVVSKMGRANGLTIDFKDSRLFWTDIDNMRIESSDLDGHSRKVIVGNLPQPYGLTLYEDFVYWADWETGTIERANKTNGENKTRIQGQLDFIMDILVFHSSRQSGKNPCTINNGGCSHLCLAVPVPVGSRNHTCSCPTHYRLGDDGKTCRAPKSFLLFSQKTVVSRFVDDINEAPTLILPIHNMRNVRAIDYDPVDEFVYWIDGRGHTLRRAHHNGTLGQVFVSNPSEKIYPYSIAVEPFTRVILWSCAMNNVINVTKLDGRQVGSIIGHEEEDQPRALAVHSVMGVLFFVNMLTPPVIEMAHLDGLHRKKIITERLKTPSALAVDVGENMLFWADTGTRVIETSGVNGEDRKLLVDRDIKQPVGLAVHGNFLYWVDKELSSVTRVNKYTGQEREKIQERITHLSDIIAVTPHLSQVMKFHPCHNGSECSHLCIGRDNKQHCTCPEGKSLADDLKTCINPPSCQPKEFRCHSGSVDCIPLKWRCDGQPECQDKSDEWKCPHDLCLSSQFRCSNTQCIDKSLVCDGKDHCDDGGDEVGCCSVGEVLCVSTGRCVDTANHCARDGLCPDHPSDALCSTVVTNISDELVISKAPYIIGVVASIVVLICVAALVVYYRRKPSLIDDHELEPQPKPSQARQYQLVVTQWGKTYSAVQGEPPMGEPHSAMNMGSGPGPPGIFVGVINSGAGARRIFDPAPVTGASSSSSSMTHYPRETLNPPPTPVVENRGWCQEPRCCCNSHHATPSTLHSYRHYKTRNRPPPPTPCSTDVCDSDVYSSAVSPRGAHCYTPGSTTYYSSPPMTDYDSDPHPPPPTPQMQYICDLTSCPPSPSTEKSYCTRAPCPPPPSPIASD